MRDFYLVDQMLLEAARRYNLAEASERARSNKRLVDLFLTIQERCRPDLTFEIGAFQADFSIAVKRRLPHVQAIAFEANPHNFQHFGNAAKIKSSDINYVHAAIAEHSGTISFHISKRLHERDIPSLTPINSILKRSGQASESEAVSVPCVTLTDYMTKNALLDKRFSAWIDVEGASRQVFSGAASVMRNCLSIFVEVEQRQIWDDQWLFWDVYEFLAKHGFVAIARDFEYAHQFNVVFIAQPLLRDASVRDAICRHHSAIEVRMRCAKVLRI